jgi:hypothetical protein
MNHVWDPPARQHLEAAFEATCDALSVLQVIDARADEQGSTKLQTKQAIESLRRAIADLRAARGTEPSALSFGFVAGATDTRSGVSAEPLESAAHSNPRRTA